MQVSCRWSRCDVSSAVSLERKVAISKVTKVAVVLADGASFASYPVKSVYRVLKIRGVCVNGGLGYGYD